ncbi:MAG: hypothetical protein HY809_08655 [Nitrospirae bacterium]|nr:hypothetical protein [Nitrospirota bacterium]
MSLNRLAAESARKKEINFIDLHPIFEADYAKHGKELVFKYDGHWNAYAHNVAAGVIAGFILENIPNK